MQSFKTFTGNHRVYLHHLNGITLHSVHAGTKYGYHEANMEAQAAAIENRCKTSVIHDSFGPMNMYGADGKPMLHEEHLEENDDRIGHNIFHAAAKEKEKLEKEMDKLKDQRSKLKDDSFEKWKSEGYKEKVPKEHPHVAILTQKINELDKEHTHHCNLMNKHFYDRKDDVYISKDIGTDGSTNLPLRKWRDDWLDDMVNHYKTTSSDRKKIHKELTYRRY